MIAHEIRLSSDTNKVIGWLDVDKDSRESAAIEIPVPQSPMEAYWEDEDAGGRTISVTEVLHNAQSAEGRCINWRRLGIGSPCEFSVLRLPFVTTEKSRYLVVEPESLPILQQIGCFRPLG